MSPEQVSELIDKRIQIRRDFVLVLLVLHFMLVESEDSFISQVVR
jgi:hypothetical protein